jgi:hypothetical protein
MSEVIAVANVPFEITDEFMEDVMISAWDGAYGSSRYWGDAKQSDAIKLSKGEIGEMPVRVDIDDWEPERGTIQMMTREDFGKGVQRWITFMVERKRFSLESLDPGNIDADDADAIVQLALFGKIVYG